MQRERIRAACTDHARAVIASAPGPGPGRAQLHRHRL